MRPTRSPTARLISRLGTHLIETGQDLAALKEIVDDLGETQAKEMLTVSVASAANDYAETRRRSGLN